MRRTDGGTGRQSIVVMRFDAARRVDGDGFLVMQCLSRGLLICREVRRTRLHGDFPEIRFRGVGDLRHTHDTIPARVGRAAGDRVLFLRAVLPRLFTHIVRADGRLAVCRHGRTVTDGDFRRGVDGVPRVRAGAAVAARADGLDLIVSSVFMIRRNLRAARLDLDVLPDRGFCLMIHLDTDDSDRSIDDAAASGDGMRVSIVVIRRHRHRRAGDELVRRRERCPVSDGDMRGVFGLDLCYGHPHAADADARRGRERGYLRCVFRRKGNGFPRELRVLPDLGRDIHCRRKVCARPGAAENACRCSECIRIHRGLGIRRDSESFIRLHFALVLALLVSDARLQRAGDIRCDDSTIQRAVERHRGPGHIRRQRAVIVRRDGNILRVDGIRIAKERRDSTLVRPCPDRSLPGHAAGDGSPCDVFIKVVRGFCGNGKILPCRHRRRLVHERLCLRVCMQYADGRADARHRAARETAHDVLHGEMVICFDSDITRRRDDRPVSDLRKRAFLACAARRLRYESRTEARLHFSKRLRVIRIDGFARVLIDVRKFLIHPAVKADGLSILARFARERLLVFFGHGTADAIDGNAARKAERANGSRNRIRHDAMHIVFRFDGHAAARCDLVPIAEESIRLRLNISHIDGCADRRTAGAGRRGDGVLHFLDFMRRRERDILRSILAVAGLLVNLHARIRVCLRDRGEVHHIRRAREADIGAARRLQ